MVFWTCAFLGWHACRAGPDTRLYVFFYARKPWHFITLDGLPAGDRFTIQKRAGVRAQLNQQLLNRLFSRAGARGLVRWHSIRPGIPADRFALRLIDWVHGHFSDYDSVSWGDH